MNVIFCQNGPVGNVIYYQMGNVGNSIYYHKGFVECYLLQKGSWI